VRGLVYLTLRLSRELKELFIDYCDKRKTTLSAEIRDFAERFTEGGLGIFSHSHIKGIAGYALSYTNFDDKICIRMGRDARDGFVSVCEKEGVPASYVLRAFIECAVGG